MATSSTADGIWCGCAHGSDERHENWLLIKAKDDEARGPRDKDILEEKSRSAVTGRSIDEIAAGKGKKRVWHSNRAAGGRIGSTRRAFKRKIRSSRQSPAASRAAKAKRATHDATSKPAAQNRRDAAQIKLPAKVAKLPEFVPPSLATLHDKAPSGPTGCTKSSSTAIAWKRGSNTARYGC